MARDRLRGRVPEPRIVTAAEQLAAAIQLLLDEQSDKIRAASASRPSDDALRTKEAAAILGLTPSFTARLAKAGVLKSYGEGRGRRYLPADVEECRRRTRASKVRVWRIEDAGRARL